MTKGPHIEARITRAIRLWIISLNYAPEPTGFAPHATALAEHMAAKGNDVTVVTGFPFAPRWQRWPEYRGIFTSLTLHNGVMLRRISHFVPRRPGSIVQRVAMEASFCVAALALLWPRFLSGRHKPDIVLYIGAQPALAMLARIVARLSRAPYFVNVNDLAAQAASDVGIIGAGRVQRMLERVEFAAYLPATGATVLCRSFADALLSRGYDQARIRLLRSPVDLERIRPLPPGPEHRRGLSLPADAFVVLFAGSMGLKQGLTAVVEAAHRLRKRETESSPVIWMLVGDGETYDAVAALVRQHGLGGSVLMSPFQPEEKMSSMFAAADVLLVSQLASVKDTVIPSKLLTYMAAGRPVLASVNDASQGAEILREANGGVLVAPENPDSLVEGVRTLQRVGPSARAAMGQRNRAYAETHFDQRKILGEHEVFLMNGLRPSHVGYVSDST